MHRFNKATGNFVNYFAFDNTACGEGWTIVRYDGKGSQILRLGVQDRDVSAVLGALAS